MIVATIDIGTNTVLLLVSKIDDAGAITPLVYEQRIPRLGKYVDAKGVIAQPAFDLIGNVLSEFKRLAESHSAQRIAVVGTSAFRDATNQSEFITFIKETTGLEVEVISGEQEALLTYRGAIFGLQNQNGATATLDIGGGSTELTLGTGETVESSYSMPMGSVRLRQRFLRHDPPLLSELAYATEHVQNMFSEVGSLVLDEAKIIGVAGTLTTLAVLDQGLTAFDVAKVAGYSLSKDSISKLYYQLRAMTAAEIRSLSQATEGRADILAAGTLILHEFMNAFKAETIYVSERGVRYGLALREWARSSAS